jgi:predicted DNA-binding protein with PD1-like motif
LFNFGFLRFQNTAMKNSNQKVFALRLQPEEDLKESLLTFARQHYLKAAYIITCVGSLQQLKIRPAGADGYISLKQKMEIVSLVGTLFDGGCHFHIALSDAKGAMIGGHLMDGCIIYTTAEIVIGEALDLQFSREYDALTTYSELCVVNRL